MPSLDRLALSQCGVQPVRILMPEGANGEQRLHSARWTLTPRLNGRTVQVVQYRLSGAVLPPVEHALPLGERVRRAVLFLRAPGGHSPQLTGKDEAGNALEGNSHAHFLASDEDGDGRLETVTVFAPRGLSPRDVDALMRLRMLTSQHAERLEVRAVSVGDIPSSDGGIFGSSRRWRSVTPYSLPRFASRGQGLRARPRDLPEGQLRRELKTRGLPEPVTVVTLPGLRVGVALHPWHHFEHRRLKGTTGHGLTGFELTFAEPLTGPLTLGFGSHFGLGIFQPVQAEE